MFIQSSNFKLYGIEIIVPSRLEEREAVVMGRINVDLNAKVNISSGPQILVYVFYYLCTIYIINLKNLLTENKYYI